MDGKARPEAFEALLPGAEGLRHLLPAAPSGFGPSQGFPELARPQGLGRQALGQAWSGRRRGSPGAKQRAAGGRCRPSSFAAGAGSAALRSEGVRRRSPVLGRGEGSLSPLCRPRPRRERAGAELGLGAGQWAPLPGYSLPAARSPGLGGLRPRQPAVLCAPLAPRCVKRQAGAAQLGSPDSFFPFPGSRRVEPEANPSRTCAPINSARVPASRSPGCARTEKVVRRDSGRAAEAGEDPAGRAALHPRTDPANSCFPCWGPG